MLPSVKNWSVLRRAELPELLRHTALFLDLSDDQAFRRKGLKGMACGGIPVVPVLGEPRSTPSTAAMPLSWTPGRTMRAVETAVAMDSEGRAEMRQQALETAAEFTNYQGSTFRIPHLQSTCNRRG